MYSAIVAVLLVNLVLGAFVVHCFLEGFPAPAPAAEVTAAAKGAKGEATEKDEVKEDKKEK